MNLFEIAKHFPPIKLKADKIQEELYLLGINLDSRKWVSFSVFLSLIVSILSSLIVHPLIGVALFLFLLYFLINLPKIERIKYERNIEEDLPLFLRDLGSLLNMGIPFIEGMEMLSKGQGSLRKEISKIIKDVKRGSSLVKALGYVANRFKSKVIKRAFAQMISAYEHGSGSELKRISSELLNIQRHKLREYAAKNALFGQLFVLFSVVGPAFYVIVEVVGPQLFNTTFNKILFTIGLLTLFPSLSYIILLISKMSLPPISFKESNKRNLTLPLAIIIALIFVTSLKFEEKIAVLIFLSIVSMIPLLKEFKKTIKREKIEKNLPDALLLISTLPKGSHIHHIISKIASSNIEGVSDEFRYVERQINANINVESALLDMVKRIKSPMLERVVDVLLNAFKAGGNVNERIAEIADDVLAYFELRREQTSLLSMQKYTVIAGMILVPIVLGISINLCSELMSLTSDATNIVDIQFIVKNAIPAFFIIMSSIVSNYLSSMDKSSKEIFYFSILSLTSNIIFYMIMHSHLI